MKLKFTYLNFLLAVAVLLFSQGLVAQTNGDYQSAGSGNWSNPSTWSIFAAGSWTPATTYPRFTDGAITIRGTDSVSFDLEDTLDQVTVNGILNINQNGSPIHDFTLNGLGSGADLTINGTLYLGGTDTLTGIGTSPKMVVSSGAVMNWTSGALQAVSNTVASGGIINIGNSVSIPKNIYHGAVLINNGTAFWNSGTSVGGIDFFDGVFTNNGTLTEQFASDRGFFPDGGTTNSFTNNGVFNKTTAFAFFNNGINFTNAGTITGQGSLSLNGTIANTGVIVPGSTTGTSINTLTTTGNLISGLATTVKSFINTTGAVSGVNYDATAVSTAGAVDLSLASLTVTDLAHSNDPVGTVYTVFSTAGTITPVTGFGGTITLSTNLGLLTTNSNSVTVQKIGVLPLNWGPFSALASGSAVHLTWSTYQESNTSYFSVQYSSNGKDFTQIGTVAAAGNSSAPSHYSFSHNSPQLNGSNYYRLLEVDLDGKPSYSSTQVVRFSNGNIIKLLATPNPTHDVLQLNAQEQGISAILVDGDGKALRTWILQPGTQQVNISSLPAGMYQLIIYQNQQRIDTQHIIKF